MGNKVAASAKAAKAKVENFVPTFGYRSMAMAA